MYNINIKIYNNIQYKIYTIYIIQLYTVQCAMYNTQSTNRLYTIMYDINIQYSMFPFKDIVNCLVSVGHNVVIIFHPKAQKFAPSFLPSNESTFQHFRYASPEIQPGPAGPTRRLATWGKQVRSGATWEANLSKSTSILLICSSRRFTNFRLASIWPQSCAKPDRVGFNRLALECLGCFVHLKMIGMFRDRTLWSLQYEFWVLLFLPSTLRIAFII